jgi:hypothetical protein
VVEERQGGAQGDLTAVSYLYLLFCIALALLQMASHERFCIAIGHRFRVL